MDSVSVKNLEQIQETEGDPRSARAATLLLAGLGGAALVVAAVFAMKQGEPPSESKADPLAALVAKAKHPEATPPETVQRAEVTFPSVLSDSERPTTALAAVKDERGHLVPAEAALPPGMAPALPAPFPKDKLPVVPLPAGTLLDATAVTTTPKDSLTTLAVEVSKVDNESPAIPGMEGGYQLQVASFKDQADAEKYVGELQKRGHRAYRQSAYVSDRGLWHRVRIGPFKTKLAAAKYKEEFERKERMTAFLVDPDRVKRQEEQRSSKLATRAAAQEQ
jgi:cell division septation protein DedD